MKPPLMTPWLACAARWLAAMGLTMAWAGVAMAQTAGPLLAGAGGASAARQLGTLILSPAQRRHLESIRSAAGSVEGSTQVLPGNPSSDVAAGLPDALVVSGVVVRSDNRSTVWVNEQPLYGRAVATPLRTLAGRTGVLQPEGRDMRIKARPGQVVDVPSGQSVDLLPPGAIRIIPPKIGAGGFPQKD